MVADFLNILGRVLTGEQFVDDEEIPDQKKYEFDEIMARKEKDIEVRPCSDLNVQHDMASRVPESIIGDAKAPLVRRYEFFVTRREQLSKLKSVMKAQTDDAKLSSFFTTLVALAQKELYEEAHVNDKLSIQYNQTCSLRDKLDIDNSVMGMFVSNFSCVIAYDELTRGTFWKVVDEQSKSLHKQLEHNIEFAMMKQVPMLIQYVNSQPAPPANTPPMPVNSYFGVSNMGLMPNTSLDSIIRITESHFITSCAYGRIGYGFSMLLANLDGNNYWSLQYFERQFSAAFMKKLVERMQAIAENICNGTL